MSAIAFMDVNLRIQRLRRQRNAALAFAVIALAAGVGLSLPRSLARYRELRAMQAELVNLQSVINSIQEQNLREQVRLREVQGQIAVLLGRSS